MSRILRANIHYELRWTETVEIEVSDDCDEVEADEALTRAICVRTASPPDHQPDVRYTSWGEDYTFSGGKPDEPPPEAWGEAHGHRWATDGCLMVREDGPRPPRSPGGCRWMIPPPSFEGMITRREALTTQPPAGLELPGRGYPRSEAVLSAGEIAFDSQAAHVWRSDDPVPVAIVALCRMGGGAP